MTALASAHTALAGSQLHVCLTLEPALSTTLPGIRELGRGDKARSARLCGRGGVVSSPGDTVFPFVKGP